MTPIKTLSASALLTAAFLVGGVSPSAASSTTPLAGSTTSLVPVSSKKNAPTARRRKPHAQAYSGSLKKGRKHQRTVKVPSAGKGGVADPGDDYPASLKNRPMDSVFDQWRMYNRECTSFVAWALSSRNGFNIPFWANANQWGPNAARRGFAVNGTPAAGSVAWSRAGTYGHVAYVQEVAGESVRIQEYNLNGRGIYSTRTVPASSFSGYIHFADRQVDPAATPAPSPAPTTPAPAPTTPAPAPTYAETTGGAANTWTNYSNAGGTQGPTIPSNTTVQIACKITGFRVADGNDRWYRIAQAPWNGSYYASADAFYNNGATSGPLKGTPFDDPNVQNC